MMDTEREPNCHTNAWEIESTQDIARYQVNSLYFSSIPEGPPVLSAICSLDGSGGLIPAVAAA